MLSEGDSVVENMSGRKLLFVGSILLTCQLLSFLIGAIVSPNPNGSDQILASKCIDHIGNQRDKWFYPRGDGSCVRIENFSGYDDSYDVPHLSADNVVFSFQIPHAKQGIQLDFSRWQQNLIGILSLDIEYEDHIVRDPRVHVSLDAKLGYRNKGDNGSDWKVYAASMVHRNLDCYIDDDHKYNGNFYDCLIMPLFELGSLHHDFYLLNIRIPAVVNHEGQVVDINEKLGKLIDLWLVMIYQNGGFTQVWLALKCFFFPIVALCLLWFWRRVFQANRPSLLLERLLLALGIAMTCLNAPLELFTLRFDMPWINLINDIKQGVFYMILMMFWLVFSGEHMVNTDTSPHPNTLFNYWKTLVVVLFGCLCLFLFDMCERGVQLINPFYSIWVGDVGSLFAFGFIILAGISAGIYFIFLCYSVYRVFMDIAHKQNSVSRMSRVRRLYYQGIIWRFKFLMLATLVTAALTVIGFILGQVADGHYKWNDTITLKYSSGFITGVYGTWNVYVFGLLFLYAPSHKIKNQSDHVQTETTGEEIEFSLQNLTTAPFELSSLTNLIRHQATD